MNSQFMGTAIASLLFVACGAPEGDVAGQEIGAIEQKSIAGEPLVSGWQNGDWIQTIYADGNGYITQRGPGFDCWSVGDKSFRNLVKTGTNSYSGECGLCSGLSVTWHSVAIVVSSDGLWMTETCGGSTSSWYKVP
ncbi:hypothetical protein COCOR_05047 [Corallococcus coralloides DSM 2259]|uniref:Uncharacterized protein n=1 Tax=Corallococcus coralloides (strain ATCC 25202 / DSM 2259 / NBRC 100086 / M2) TaxID=1144275 RepID=H8MQ14_CORCM|nr:hypothetical protein COCOR_05047 [Corallococcus coralloides DSM 2259]